MARVTADLAVPPAAPRVAKAHDAFRTISEVAAELDIPQHVLRFWETRFAQIKPLKRAGGRRYYRPEDVELLGRIRQLLYRQGYTIKGVQRLLRDGTIHDAPAADPTAAEAPEPARPGPTSKQLLDQAIVELEDVTRELRALRRGLSLKR
jgi:DNA-binding transcriptional MerR regulator